MKDLLLQKQSLHIYFVGIKGSGMASLALLFARLGNTIFGSDIPEVFYTDTMLRSQGITWVESFSAKNLPMSTDVLIYSDAWKDQNHPEIREAKRRDIILYSYSEVLGKLSMQTYSVAVAGVHGKTTTTALLSFLCDTLSFPVTAIIGGAVKDFSNMSLLFHGTKCFISETCEYRKNFLLFHPDILLVTSIEWDHTDFYKSYHDIFQAFLHYALQLSFHGTLVYCADNEGCVSLAQECIKVRPDLLLVPYGQRAEGMYAVSNIKEEPRQLYMRMPFHGEWTIRHPAVHSLINVAGTVAVLQVIGDRLQVKISWEKIKKAIARFQGVARRHDVIGEIRGITIIDDYAHHPTAIRNILTGLRRFYHPRRVIVDFMSHTYSRTESFLEDFAKSFQDADEIIINDIYSSARERKGEINGKKLSEAISQYHSCVRYEPSFQKIIQYAKSSLQEGDLFVTLGAGNNWEIAHAVYSVLRGGS